MVILRKTGPHLVVVVEDNILVHNLKDASYKTFKIEEPPVEPNLTNSLLQVLKPENRYVTSVCTSQNAEYLALTLQNRQLLIYDSEFNVISNVLTKRAASRARFMKQNHNILVADKTGDVYLYKFNKINEEPELLLGHLSMLLDVAVSECGKYVITCDRDEKIRVSHYPNAYNIQSYCLGHREFVSNLEVSGNILISASGDGTIRFWNFCTGTELAVVNSNDYITDKSVIEKFCQEMDDEKVDISAVPIIDLQVFENILGVTLLGCNTLQLYRFEINTDGLKVHLLESLEVPSEIISFSLGSELYVLTNNELLVYISSKTGFKRTNRTGIEEFFEVCRKSFPQKDISSSISALYKRKFDNVQDYLDKKRLRIESKS